MSSHVLADIFHEFEADAATFRGCFVGVVGMRGTPPSLNVGELGGISQKFVIVDCRKFVRVVSYLNDHFSEFFHSD